MASPPQSFSYYNPPPPKGSGFSLEQFIRDSTVATDLLTLACFVAFALLIGFDVLRAFTKRAIWLPGKAFTLSGVTVQIIVWWTSLSNIINGYSKEIAEFLHNHYMVVVGRIAVCVFIAYLLPGMAAPSVRVFGALAVTIFAQIASELLLLFNPTQPVSESGYTYIYKACAHNYTDDFYNNKYLYVDDNCMKRMYSEDTTSLLFYFHEELTWSKTADLIILTCLVLLGSMLCCTILASKTIHSLLKQKISVIAGKSKERFQFSGEKTEKWKDFENEVLRSWFVARVCQDDYVISRSVFSSAVWIIVTLCFIVFHNSYEYIYLIPTLSPLMGFSVIAYVVICWRCLASQLYCSQLFCPSISSKRKYLCFEDFWTSRTVELMNMYDIKRERQEFQGRKSNQHFFNKLQRFPANIFTKVRLHRLLYLVLMLQVFVLFFSKVCGILSELTVGNFVYCCRSFVRVCQKRNTKENQAESDVIYTTSLEILCMPGDDTSSIWEGNRMSLNKTRRMMEKGCEEGISCEEINSIFHPYSLEWEEKGTQLLKELKEKATPSVLNHFPSLEKNCLKMTVVSLMTILIGLHKGKSDRLTKVVKACHQVWDLVSFADECDIDLQADKINLLDDLNEDKDQVILAADRKFYKLQMEYDKLPSMPEDPFQDAEKVHEFLKKLSQEHEDILRKENLLEDNKKCHDSKNSLKIAPIYTMYKLCKLMKDKPIENLVEWTEDSLRNVIACSMSRLPNMLVKQCWIWAQEFEEDKLWEAIQLAGKCKGMLEEWGKDTKTIVNTKEHKTLWQHFKFCILCCRREEQTNRREQPVSNIDQYTIQVNEP